MPYKKLYGRKGRGQRKKSNWYGKGKSAIAIASQALSMAMMLKRLINVERKYVLTSATGTSVPSAGSVVLLSGIAQGITESTRNGNKVKSHDIYLRFYLQSIMSQTAFVRIMLVNDKSSQGTLPVISDILESAILTSPLNVEQCPSRFNVLHDHVYDVDTSKQLQLFKTVYRKLGYHSTFSGTSAAQSDCENGHLYLIFLTNVGTNLPNITYTAKYGYIDN